MKLSADYSTNRSGTKMNSGVFRPLALSLSMMGIAAALLTAPFSADAADYNWQVGGTTNIWSTDGADTNWFIDAGTTLSPWVDSNDALFSGTGEAITLSGTISPTSTTIGAGNGAWTFGGTGVLGGGPLTKSGTGGLTFTNASNNFSSISVSGGPANGNGATTAALGISNYAQLGSGQITFSNSASISGLYVSAVTAGSLTNALALSGSAVTTQFSGVSNANRVVSLDGAITGGIAGATLFFTNSVSGGAGVYKLTNASNTFTGTLQLDRGGLEFTSNAALGNASNTIRLDVAVTTAGTGLRFGANNLVIASTHAVNVTDTALIDTQAFTGSEIAGTVTINSGRALNKQGSTNLLLSGVVAGPGNITAGAGALTLSNNANIYSGVTTLSGGTLVGTVAHAFGNTSSIAMQEGSILSLRGNANTSFTKTTDGASYTVTTSASGTTLNVDQATVAGTAAKTMTIGAIGTTLTTATYLLNFTGANLTGLTTGAVTGAQSVAVGTVTLNNTNVSGTTRLASYTSANTAGGETVIFSGNGNTTVTGAITPSATVLALTKNGTGTLLLSGNNTYSGVTNINGGSLILSGDNTGGGFLRTGGAGTNPARNVVTISILAGGSKTHTNAGNQSIIGQNVAFHDGILNVAGTYAQSGSSFFLGNNVSTATGTLNVENGGLVSFTSAMINSSAAGTIGAAGVVLGRDSASGTINVETGGVLQSAKNIVRGNGTGTFNFNGGTLRAASTGQQAGDFLAVTTATINAGAIIDTNGSNVTVGQSLLAGTGAGNLQKIGAGTLTLSGANTYTGATTVSAGTLSLGASNVIPNTSALVLSGGTLLTGTGQTETAASLSLTLASTITMSGTSGTSSLTFLNGTAGSSGISAANTLSIWNWNGSVSGGGADQLIVPAGSLNSTELGNISFYADNGQTLFNGLSGAAFSSGGELVPVPEPAALASTLLLAAYAFGRGRSQSARCRSKEA